MIVNSIAIKRKEHGHYVIMLDIDGKRKTVGAAKGSPVAQCIRLLERLLTLEYTQ